MQNALRPAQPKYIDAQRHILSMVSAGKIARLNLDPVTVRQDSEGDVADAVLQLLRDAIVNDSFVLDFLPPGSTDPMHPTQTLPAQYADTPERCSFGRGRTQILRGAVCAGTSQGY